MAKSLVIVESPAKAKTINKFLGRTYIVRASMGHIRDLPKKEMGINIEDGFKPKYVVIRGRGKTLEGLRREVRKADNVYLAPDCDREGEAIAWHLAEYLKIPEKKIRRVIFNEITKNAIKKAFKQWGKISTDKVNAQQARRILDRIVGYRLSPLLWKKFWRGLSAGRVQSVAVKLVVKREREIQAFNPEEYWEIQADVHPKDSKSDTLTLDLKKIKGEDFHIVSEDEANKAVKELRSLPFKVSSVEKKEKLDRPPAPFITSTLQAGASGALGYSMPKTMVIAQQLYEGIDIGEEGPVGLISYMRTDSTNVAMEAIEQARSYIPERFGKEYLPDKPNIYKPKKAAQEAHEAIRPTSVAYTPEGVEKYLSTDQYKVYKLIWDRFVACQMAPAVYDVTTINVTPGDYLFRAVGRITRFPGHLALTGTKGKKDDMELPAVEEGDELDLDELKPSQHFTKPPDRFTEASLVRILEKEGIGRPSTYAPILSTIVQRGYVELLKRKFYATDVGMLVTDKLVKHFPRILDTEFTARLEEDLDSIEEGNADHVKVLGDFYKLFNESIEAAEKEMVGVNENAEPTGEKCEKCGSDMLYKFNKWGKFIGCSKYPECKNTKSLSNEGRAPDEETDEKCEKCGTAMVVRTGKYGKFLACKAYPKCKNTKALDEDGKPTETGSEEYGVCEKCGSEMILKIGRRGKFVACSGFPKCKNTKNLPGDTQPEKVDEKCPKCGKDMVAKSGWRGSFLACSGYPECKTTQPLPGKEKAKPEEAGMDCENCGKPMVVRVGRGGAKFAACTGYPKCRTTRPLNKNGSVADDQVFEKCEKCGSEMVVKTGRRGKFLACNGYPKCRNTRSLPATQ